MLRRQTCLDKNYQWNRLINMAGGMMTLLNSLVALTLLVLCGTVVTLLIQNYQLQLKWMRIFCERSGLPVTTMENKPVPREVFTPKPDTRQRVSVPIPGGDMFRTKAK